jgi:hypothetical protein
MRITEITTVGHLFESVELASTLRSIASEIGNPVTAIYDKLTEFAERWSENHDSMKNFGFLEKNINDRWYNEQGDNLIAELYHLADQAPSQASAQLRRLLLSNTTTNFRTLGKNLTPILIQIGLDTNYNHLVRNAQAWQQQEKNFAQTLEKLDKYSASSSKKPSSTLGDTSAASMSPTRSEKIDQAAADKKIARAQQQIQIEQLINSVLTKIPKGVAGEIRNAISRESNKLMALQKELTKRNIKM